MAAHLGVLAEEKQQSIVVEGQVADALADRLVLRQALISLVDNAIKFTPVGGRMRLRLSETNREVAIDVIDSGPGIPEEARSRVFERYYRADERGAVHGSGLGLSIAKGAVEAIGGRAHARGDRARRQHVPHYYAATLSSAAATAGRVGELVCGRQAPVSRP